MIYSATIVLRTPAQANGLNTARLQVILNRAILRIPLGIAWPEKLFDKNAGKCLSFLLTKDRPANYKAVLTQAIAALGGDLIKKAEDNNLVLGHALGRAHEIFVRYRLSGQHLTPDDFLREYNRGASRADFLEFMQRRIDERYQRGQITKNTHKSHLSTLRKIREFVVVTGPQRVAGEAVLPFSALNHNFSHDFDAWLKKAHGSCQNTRSGRHRNVKAYLELARRDKISFENPYEYFVNSTVQGKWFPLNSEELAALEQYYTTLLPRTPHRRMLQKFLFSCHCGLRLGDLKAVGQMKSVGQNLVLQSHKTYRYDEKELVLPITKRALSYLDDSRRENECEGFYLYSDQYTNRALKAIGLQLGIATKMHHHIGRETFATEFVRRGGKVEVLQKLMGHKKLSMTMKYVHVDEAMKQAEIDRLDGLDASN